MTPAISVTGLGKRYRIGAKERADRTLREVISDLAAAPFRRLARIGQSPVPEELIWALTEVSFDVQRGEVVGVIGRNGAGKSTLLKILSRITEPTEGRVELRGRVASLLEIGTGFHRELTGRENIYLNGTILGMKKAEIDLKFDEIVAFSEIEKFLDTPVKRYSSGMSIRLAFAVAAHLDPEILLVDEVLAVGDAGFQKKCLGKMGEVARAGRTVLFVSHNMSSIQRLCPRSLLLDQGRIVADRETRSVVEDYQSMVMKQAELLRDLALLERGAGAAGNIRFSRCAVVDSTGEGSLSLKYGEPIKIYFEAVSQAKYDDLSFVVGIDALGGGRICTSVSRESGAVFSAQPGKPLRVMVEFKGLVLTPGRYDLSIAIRTGSIGLDTLMNVAGFEVSTVTYGERSPHAGTMGVVTVPAEWGASRVEALTS